MSYVSKSPGDVGYTSYAIVQTLKIKADQAIKKGFWYGNTASGFLADLTAGSGVITNAGGGYWQAMTDNPAPATSGQEADGARSIQCLSFKSRCIVKCAANLVQGQKVQIFAAAAVVTADKVEALVATGSRLGIIYKIFGDKPKTANGDLAYMELFY